MTISQRVLSKSRIRQDRLANDGGMLTDDGGMMSFGGNDELMLPDGVFAGFCWP